MGSMLLPSVLMQQPQQGVSLDRSNKFAANALAIVSAGADVNYATGKPLVRGGSGYAKQALPGGLAWTFRKNFYVETETMPAIGTASFVEFWVGYKNSAVGSQSDGTFPSMVLGSSANQSGICTTVGSNYASAGGGSTSSWGAVLNWNASTHLANANDIIPLGELTVLVVVRRQTGLEFWRNGRLVNFVSQSPISIPAETLICGSFIENASWSSASDTILAGRTVMPIEPTAAEIRAFSENPWQLFKASAPLAAATMAALLAAVPASTGTNVSPSAGSLALVGYAPNIAQPQAVAPSGGALAIAGYAPSVDQSAGQGISPAAASFAITGFGPTIAQPQSVAAGVGALAVTGFPPAVAQQQNVVPGVGSLTVAGFAPGVAQPIAATPDAGFLTVAGFAPAVVQAGSLTFSPGATPLVVTGYAPTVAQSSSSAATDTHDGGPITRESLKAAKKRAKDLERARLDRDARAAADRDKLHEAIRSAARPKPVVQAAAPVQKPIARPALPRVDIDEDEEELLLLLM